MSFGGGGDDSASSQEAARVVVALQAQAQFQKIALEAVKFSFERCTRYESTGELSKREQQCVRDNVTAYIRARELITKSSQG